MGSKFGQNIEPSGKYIISNAGFTPEGWQSGVITFNNPLVIDWKNWKDKLNKKYNKVGKGLRDHLRLLGYDGIITIDDKYTSEIVSLERRNERMI